MSNEDPISDPIFLIADIDPEILEILCDEQMREALKQSADDIRRGRLHHHDTVRQEFCNPDPAG